MNEVITVKEEEDGVLKYLKVGREHGISIKELSGLLEWSDRKVRAEISRLRESGTVIINLNADRTGYFLPDMPKELPLVKRWIKQEKAKAVSIFIGRRGADKLYKEYMKGESDGREENVRQDDNRE